MKLGRFNLRSGDAADALVAREQLEQAHAAKQRQSKAYADNLRLVNLRYQHGVSSALIYSMPNAAITAPTPPY